MNDKNNWFKIGMNLFKTKVDLLNKKVNELRSIVLVSLLLLALCFVVIRILQARIVDLENRIQIIEDLSKNEVQI